MEDREGMIPVAEAEQRYPVARRTVDRWVAAERLTTYKFPRDRRSYVKKADIEALLSEEPIQRRGRPRGSRKAQRLPAD